MAFSRRRFLMGVGGAMVGLPFLEGLAPKKAHADTSQYSFALFYRRGNGVQQALYDRVPNVEPERWWPQIPYGTFTPAALAGATQSAIALELAAYADKLGIVRYLRHPIGTQNGHREGFIQGLTGAGVKYPNNLENTFVCDSLGESLDNRIARNLSTNPNETSLYMSIGTHNEGDVSFVNAAGGGPAPTRAGEENLTAIYNRLFNIANASQQSNEIKLVNAANTKSVNDLVKSELTSLKSDRRLSTKDRERIDNHFNAIREAEVALDTCRLDPTLAADVAAYRTKYNSDPDWYKGNSTRAFVDVAGRLAALAIGCGVHRSVLLNIGPPQDTTPYKDPSIPGAGIADFHSISHRQSIDGDPSTNIPNAVDLHHKIDKFHLELFRGILDRLKAYDMGGGKSLLDMGVCVHYSDIGSGQHEIFQLPYLYVGSAGGKLKTGIYHNANDTMLVKFLNTIGAAVGAKNSAGTGPLDDLNFANNAVTVVGKTAPAIKGRIADLENDIT